MRTAATEFRVQDGYARKMTFRAAMLALAALPAMSACTSSLLDTDLPPNTIYVLAAAPASAAPPEAALAVDLSIGLPDVAPGLDSNRIAVLKGRKLDYYRAARWGAPTAEMVQALLVGSLEDQRRFRSVTAEHARVASDYMLDVEIRDFQAEYVNDGDAPVVHMKVIARLVRIVDRNLIATMPAESRSAADVDRMHAVAAAFEASAQDVALQLAQQAAAAVAADAAQLSAARGGKD